VFHKYGHHRSPHLKLVRVDPRGLLTWVDAPSNGAALRSLQEEARRGSSRTLARNPVLHSLMAQDQHAAANASASSLMRADPSMSSLGLAQPGEPDASKSFPLTHVISLKEGKQTEAFSRARDVPSELCFSIVTGQRTLDLQATTELERNQWVSALTWCVRA
jgi:hypothetical protein